MKYPYSIPNSLHFSTVKKNKVSGLLVFIREYIEGNFSWPYMGFFLSSKSHSLSGCGHILN